MFISKFNEERELGVCSIIFFILFPKKFKMNYVDFEITWIIKSRQKAGDFERVMEINDKCVNKRYFIKSSKYKALRNI